MATKLIEKSLGGGLKHVVYRVVYTDLIAAAVTETEALKTLPAGAEVIACWYDLVTAFAAPVATNLTLQVGTSSDTDAFVTAGELLAGPPTAGRRHVKGAWITGDAKTVNALFTATGADMGTGAATAFTAGKVDIHIVYLVAKDA